jgi:hypothetical protein
VIFFEDLSDPAAPRVAIGDIALARAKALGERPLVRNFKRRLGDPRQLQVTDSQGRSANYSAAELTAIFLREVLREVREGLDARGLALAIDAVLFTYPVLFSANQTAQLAGVLRSLGVTKVEHALDEASAGAIEAIHSWSNEQLEKLGAAAKEARSEREFVLNYDFGGGTIDIALLEVTRDYREQRVVITPIGVTGLYRFGGEDVTVLVRQLIVRRIEQKMRRRYPRFTLPCGNPAEPPGMYAVKRDNNARLGFLAEKVKIELCTHGDVLIRPGDPDLDNLWFDRGEGAGVQRSDPLRMPLLGGLDEHEAEIVIRARELDRVLAPHLEASIERAANLWRSGCRQSDGSVAPLARVLLTGRSSAIPLVRRLIEERLAIAPERIIFDAARAKEVVASGACYYDRLQAALVRGFRLEVIKPNERVLIPIGVEMIDFANSIFMPLFDAATRMEPLSDNSGQPGFQAHAELRLGFGGPVANLQLFRSLDYVDELATGGKQLVARFELRREDPFFSDWTPQELRSFSARVVLWRAASGTEHRLAVAVAHPRSGEQRLFQASFTGDLDATVGEDEEAGGVRIDEVDLPEEPRVVIRDHGARP